MSNTIAVLYDSKEFDCELIYDESGEYYSFGHHGTSKPVCSSCLDAVEAHRELMRQKEIYEQPTRFESNNPSAREKRLAVVQMYLDMIAAIPLSPAEFATVYAPTL